MSPAQLPDRRPSVWVVDDSKQQAESARRALSSRYEVQVFHDGASALERLSASAPDVLLLDWHMPHLSGLEVCRFVRESIDSSALPILFLTASADANDLVAALDAGANDFVRKPWDPAELAARVMALDRTRALYARLNTAESRLREEAEIRERFIAVLGHDLKQPLSTISATAQTLRRGEEPAASRAQRIVGAAQRMDRMIDDIVDMSRSRLGDGIALRRTHAALAAVTERVVGEMRASHPQRTISLDSSDQGWGAWDTDRIAQVCSNLIGNALKHGDRESEVVVAVVRDPYDLTLSVQNHGAPIEDGVRNSLFHAFRQGSAAAGSRVGLGLGLYIADQIVRAHDGALEVESDPDATTFCARWSNASIEAAMAQPIASR